MQLFDGNWRIRTATVSEYLPQQHAIWPHIALSRVLPVEQRLRCHPLHWQQALPCTSIWYNIKIIDYRPRYRIQLFASKFCTNFIKSIYSKDIFIKKCIMTPRHLAERCHQKGFIVQHVMVMFNAQICFIITREVYCSAVPVKFSYSTLPLRCLEWGQSRRFSVQGYRRPERYVLPDHDEQSVQHNTHKCDNAV